MKDQHLRIAHPGTGKIAVITLAVDEGAADSSTGTDIVRALWEDTQIPLTTEEIQEMESLVEDEVSL